MIIPIWTDSDEQVKPLMTLLVIGINIAVFFWLNSLTEWELSTEDIFLLKRGDGLHPLQWIFSNFAHISFSHLFFNMFALFVFGMIVEDYLGHIKFIIAYLVIGAVQGLMEQIIYLGAEESVSLGASAVIFGFMAMALIWCPKSMISMVGFIIRPFFFEMKIIYYCPIFFLIELFFIFSESDASSILHAMGIVVGGTFGVLALKRGWVDCQGWDIFSKYFSKNQKNVRRSYNLKETITTNTRTSATRKPSDEVSEDTINSFIEHTKNEKADSIIILLQSRPELILSDKIDSVSILMLLYKKKFFEEYLKSYLFLNQKKENISERLHLVAAKIYLTIKENADEADKILSKINLTQLKEDEKVLCEKLKLSCAEEFKKNPLRLEDY